MNKRSLFADLDSNITLAVRYLPGRSSGYGDPWGNAFETSGGGGFTWGYFGGMLDAATGLIYVGNGQYYLPGRSSGHGDPWGNAFETSGAGGFTWGYFGGMLDAATGLIYVGNGQYYDPVTGRFLTREARPEKANPYVPWDAAGAMIAPLGLLAFYYSRRKKDNRWGMWVALFIVAAGAGITLAGCQGGQQPTTATAIYNPTTGTAEVTTGSGTVTY